MSNTATTMEERFDALIIDGYQQLIDWVPIEIERGTPSNMYVSVEL